MQCLWFQVTLHYIILSMALYNSKVIQIGNLSIGGDSPIRIQSMTNTNTLDAVSTVNQVMQLVDAGCELVRITAQGIKEAENLRVIKKYLRSNNYNIPLIADIHYNHKAAEVAASIVEKVRINPGNYINSKIGGVGIHAHYSENAYNLELEEIKLNLLPLINICKSHGTVIRIGVNHGSLGERIVERYGDTVEGMVTSAVEYARICNELNFHNLVLSVKASNPVMMAEAYRQLAIALKSEELNYPLHLGVTEAGNGIDARMKSYVGIGTVLSYGVGDTIRVSLTEDPVNEIAVASEILKRFTDINESKERKIRNDLVLDEFFPISSKIDQSNDPFNKPVFGLLIRKEGKYFFCESKSDFSTIDESDLVEVFDNKKAKKVLEAHIPENTALIIKLSANESFKFISELRKSGYKNPLILMAPHVTTTIQEMGLENCIHPGALILNGLVQGLCLDAMDKSLTEVVEAGFDILQATRVRITKTEYVSCPSCGRTQFNIEKRLEEVRTATAHYTGLKIAVMGCIVNGPGEMADADYGYVGAGKGMVTLYKGKKVIKHSVKENDAVKELLKIIEQNKME